jgi:hypothetical protein
VDVKKVSPIFYSFLSRNIVQGYNPAASDWYTQLQMMPRPAELPPVHELHAFAECVSMPVTPVHSIRNAAASAYTHMHATRRGPKIRGGSTGTLLPTHRRSTCCMRIIIDAQ